MEQGEHDIRVGDRERREVDERLRQAHADGVLTLAEYDERAALCWAARTRGDLVPLTKDLPPTAVLKPVDTPTSAPVEPVAKPEPTQHKSRFGGAAGVVLAVGALFFGGQAVTAADGVSVFGNQQLQVSGGKDRVEVGTLFGTTTVVVPEGVSVRTTGTVIFGSVECATACQATAPGQREVVVNSAGAFGSVEILRPGEPSEDQRSDRDDDDDD